MKIIEKTYIEAVMEAFNAAVTKNYGIIIVNSAAAKERFIKTVKAEKEKKGQEFSVRDLLTSVVFTLDDFRTYKEEYFKDYNLVLFNIPSAYLYNDFKNVSIIAMIISNENIYARSIDRDFFKPIFLNSALKDKEKNKKEEPVVDKEEKKEKIKCDCGNSASASTAKNKACNCKKEKEKGNKINREDFINSLLDDFEKVLDSGFLF